MQIVTRMTKPTRLTTHTRLTRLSFDLGHLLDYLVSLIVSRLVNHLFQHQYVNISIPRYEPKNGKFAVQADSTFYPTLD